MSAAIFVVTVLSLVAALALYALIRGWVLSVLWGWFAVPVFGAPPLGIAQAVGIAIVVGMFMPHIDRKEREGAEAFSHAMAMFAAPFVALGIGWIVKGFM